MTVWRRLLSLTMLTVLVLSLFFGLTEPAAANPPSQGRDWREETIYFILTDRFNNGDENNDFNVNPRDLSAYHGGDLQGVIDKLDYIKDLGATAIWLTPVVDNQDKGYHGYWAIDFYKVDEHLGDVAKLKELVQKAHDKGIRVILDIVVNHTGPAHPWALDPAYQSWFHQRGNISDWGNQEDVETGRLAGLPDFAQENPEVEEYLIEMAKWWISETDVDGFRLDTVKHVPKWFWEKLAKEMKAVKPDFFMIGEVWSNDPGYIAGYQKTGIDYMVDYPMYYAVNDVFIKGGPISRLSTLITRQDRIYGGPAYTLGTFIDNHDNPRFVSIAGKEAEAKLKLALAWTLTSRGIPIIYYGTEVAMEGGKDPDNRRDMDFERKPEFRDWVKKVSGIRQEHPALRLGDFTEIFADKTLLVFSRLLKDDQVLVALNNSSDPGHETVDATRASLKDGTRLKDLLTGKVVRVKDGQIALTLEPRQTQILKVLPGNSISAASVAPWFGGAVLVGVAGLWWLGRARRK